MNDVSMQLINASHYRLGVRLLEKLTEAACAGYHLSRAEIDVLTFLTNNPELDTASAIVEYRQMSKSGVSQAVEQLIQKGLLLRQVDQKDRRVIHLQPTEAAQPLQQALAGARKEMIRLMFEGFTEEELQLYLKLTLRTQINAKNALERI